MPTIRPISDLRNNANEISDFCRQTHEPVYITRNGSGDMVVLSMEEYERQQALIDLYGKLAVAEQERSSSPSPTRRPAWRPSSPARWTGPRSFPWSPWSL